MNRAPMYGASSRCAGIMGTWAMEATNSSTIVGQRNGSPWCSPGSVRPSPSRQAPPVTTSGTSSTMPDEEWSTAAKCPDAGPAFLGAGVGPVSLDLGAHHQGEADQERQQQPDRTGGGEVRPLGARQAAVEHRSLGVVEVDPGLEVAVPGLVRGEDARD